MMKRRCENFATSKRKLYLHANIANKKGKKLSIMKQEENSHGLRYYIVVKVMCTFVPIHFQKSDIKHLHVFSPL